MGSISAAECLDNIAPKKRSSGGEKLAIKKFNKRKKLSKNIARSKVDPLRVCRVFAGFGRHIELQILEGYIERNFARWTLLCNINSSNINQSLEVVSSLRKLILKFRTSVSSGHTSKNNPMYKRS